MAVQTYRDTIDKWTKMTIDVGGSTIDGTKITCDDKGVYILPDGANQKPVFVPYASISTITKVS